MLYPYEITEASRSALLELGLALHQYHDDMVLTGGWAPYFLTKGHFQHCGSVDIDLTLKTEILPRYDTIREILEGLGYVAKAYRPFQFTRSIRSHIDGKEYPMHLDLLCEKEGMQDVFGFRDVQVDLQACAFDGLSLAFDFNFEQEIETVLPGNGIAKTTLKVVDLVGSLALKGRALLERDNPKDSYDIFALTHYNGGPAQASEYFKKTVSGKKLSPEKEKLLDGSLSNIAYGFKDESHVGPFRVESFSENRYKRNIVAMQVNQFLKGIK